jgi:hypothetical protein
MRTRFWLNVFLAFVGHTLVVINAFIPLRLVDMMIRKTDEETRLDLGMVGETLTHEEILKRGMLRSVAKYFHSKSSNDSFNRIKLTKLETGEYFNVRELFKDFYNNS